MTIAAFLAATGEERRSAHQKIIRYLFEHAMRRRDDPGDDLVSSMATRRTDDGQLLPLEDVVLNLDNILVGGVQTVRHTATMGMLALPRHPNQLAKLWRGDVEMDTAVEELLRWTSSGLHVLRFASVDGPLGPVNVRAGDKVVVRMWAANHHPAHFDHPEQQRLDRSPNRHLAMGPCGWSRANLDRYRADPGPRQ